ncbi:MAG: hypothetical protein WC812_00185 [Candidatus Pacearchaeota archaeon]|jgi:hypothetical protein
MEKNNLLKDFEREFEKFKKEYKFKASFEELEKEFSIKDFVLEEGFVREDFSISICLRIVDHFRNWAGYLNNLLLPNPSFMVSSTEAKLFNSEKDRKEIWEVIKKCMYFSSKHSLITLNKDDKIQAEFIDEALNSWKNYVKPFVKKTMQRIFDAWKE